MIGEILLISGVAFLAAAWMTAWVRRMAIARGILDSPNERSSHTRVTPRGGGMAIVTISISGMLLLYWRHLLDAPLAIGLVAGGLPVAAIGFVDDRRSVSAGLRLLVHLASAGLAVWALGGLPPLQYGTVLMDLGAAGDLLAVAAIVWAINLFNFMDGIDGIAASEAVFIGGVSSALALGVFDMPGIAAAGAVFAASCLGFLLLNWPPARVFMGDVGSGYLGFILAVLALGATRESAVLLPIWLILGGIFIVDATLTLCRRLVRRERFYEAHRSHAYQWLVRRWNSHLAVTMTCIALNMLWLAPWAWACVLYPDNAWWFVIAAWGPVIALAAISGAGRPESSARHAG